MSTGLLDSILSKMPGMNKWRKDFFRHAIHLFLCMRGRHNFENMGHFTACCEEPTWCLYEAVVHCKDLRRWVKVAVLHELDEKGKVKRVRAYASTDLQMPGHDVFIYYKSRFQMEFLYCDAKGHTGLEHCQRRNDDWMGFHHNLSLTAASVAKAMFWYGQEKQEKGAFTIADIKAQLFNELMLERIFSVFGKDADPLKNHPAIVHIRNFGIKSVA